jgi:SAM-dependent methyltransferase
MTTAAEHYERLLAEHYTWMLGDDIEAAAAAQAVLLREAGLEPGTTAATAPRAAASAVLLREAGLEPGTAAGSTTAGAPPGGTASRAAIAVDLGCGPGPQTLALARLGYAPVVAVDTSARLLAELSAHAARAGLADAVRPVHGDMRHALAQSVAPGTADVVVCMGDTLPHLPTRADVPRLLGDVAAALRPGGQFLATYRDLTAELAGTDRFIPVRSTDDRLLTCFLDYTDADTVQVHDLLYAHAADGSWELRTSSYPKLRLAPAWLAERCALAGLDVLRAQSGPRGLQILHAAKPLA